MWGRAGVPEGTREGFLEFQGLSKVQHVKLERAGWPEGRQSFLILKVDAPPRGWLKTRKPCLQFPS